MTLEDARSLLNQLRDGVNFSGNLICQALIATGDIDEVTAAEAASTTTEP